DATPGAIDDSHARLRPLELSRADEAAGLLRQRDVNRDEVRTAEERVEVDKLDAEAFRDLRAEVRVVGDDGHREALGAPGDLRADPPESDDTQRLAVHLHPDEALPFPLAVAEVRVGLRKLPRDGEEERHRVLGSRDRVAAGGVHADDAAP